MVAGSSWKRCRPGLSAESPTCSRSPPGSCAESSGNSSLILAEARLATSFAMSMHQSKSMAATWCVCQPARPSVRTSRGLLITISVMLEIVKELLQGSQVDFKG